MIKDELIARLSKFVRANANSYGWCYDVCGWFPYKGEERGISATSFSEINGEKGKLFFLSYGHGTQDDVYRLAEDIDERILKQIINETKKYYSI